MALALLTGACRERPAGETPDGGSMDGSALVCTVQPPTVCPDPMPRWADVSSIFQQRCAICHNMTVVGAQWPLMQYQHVADWADLVRAMLVDCSMPPPDSGVRITDEERLRILTWILCGFPE
jgi:hypothetical protein